MTKKTDIPELAYPDLWRGWDTYDFRAEGWSKFELWEWHKHRKEVRLQNAAAMTRRARRADPRTRDIPDSVVRAYLRELRLMYRILPGRQPGCGWPPRPVPAHKEGDKVVRQFMRRDKVVRHFMRPASKATASNRAEAPATHSAALEILSASPACWACCSSRRLYLSRLLSNLRAWARRLRKDSSS